LTVATVAMIAPSAHASDTALDKYPSLKPVLEQIRIELELTDDQIDEASALITGQIASAKKVVDEIDDFDMDSLIDLLVEARTIRDHFIPELKGVINDKQRKKLQALPTSSNVYISAMSGWLTEATLEKLTDELGLGESQIPGIREDLNDQLAEALELVLGLTKSEAEPKDLIMDVLIDLNMMGQLANRAIEQHLDDDQKKKFEEMQD